MASSSSEFLAACCTNDFDGDWEITQIDLDIFAAYLHAVEIYNDQLPTVPQVQEIYDTFVEAGIYTPATIRYLPQLCSCNRSSSSSNSSSSPSSASSSSPSSSSSSNSSSSSQSSGSSPSESSGGGGGPPVPDPSKWYCLEYWVCSTDCTDGFKISGPSCAQPTVAAFDTCDEGLCEHYISGPYDDNTCDGNC